MPSAVANKYAKRSKASRCRSARRDRGRGRLSASLLAEHRQSMAFAERITALVQDRLNIARDLRPELRRLQTLYALAVADVRAMIPIVDAELRRQYDDLSAVTRLAMRTHQEEAAVLGARALYANALQPAMWSLLAPNLPRPEAPAP